MDTRKIIPKNSRLRGKTYGYTFFYYTLLFLFLSLVGWLWEVGLYFVLEQRFVNRGVLFGPWLPIYGIGGLFLYFLLYRLKRKPFFVFLLAVLVCSFIEYLGSWFLERQWNIRWWDYSDYFMNLHGRICLWASMAFGTGALLLLYVFVPCWEKIYEKVPSRIRKTAGLVLLLLFLIDATYAAASPNTGRGVSSPTAWMAEANIEYHRFSIGLNIS